MLSCRDPSGGYAEYICLKCGKEKRVAFTCKGRFCTSCGKKYIDEWVRKTVHQIIDVTHRHLVFTIPEGLREKIFSNRSLIKVMMDCLAERRLRLTLRKIAFPLYMKQAPDGKHLYSNAIIAEKVSQGVSQKSAKKITRNTIQKWALRTNEDGTTWKGSFNKALAHSKVSQGVSQSQPKWFLLIARERTCPSGERA